MTAGPQGGQGRHARMALLIVAVAATLGVLAFQSVLSGPSVTIVGTVSTRCGVSMPERITVRAEGVELWSGAARWSMSFGECSTPVSTGELDAFDSYTITAGSRSELISRDRAETTGSFWLS